MLLLIGGAAMKLFVSAFLLAVGPFALAQNQTPALNSQPDPVLEAKIHAQAAQIRVQLQAQVDKANQTGCPLYLKSASVAPAAGLLPVGTRNSGDDALNLHFRNQSGKAIRSASITAHLKVKTNVYALDARPLEVQLSFSGTSDLDKEADQLTRITLPGHVYLFGVATVSLDQVTFADGSFWIADRGGNSCSVGGAGTQLLQAK
jgi:hypothetical protein